MSYTSYQPHPALASYIDAYWCVKGTELDGPVINKVLPDGCMDIIFNHGEDAPFMQHGRAHLVGTMTRPVDVQVGPNSWLTGVRFKPAAFPVFYKFSSLHALTDEVIECENGLAPVFGAESGWINDLNKYFLERLTRPRHGLFPILEDIYHRRGQVRVEELARQHYITVRQLERQFKYYTGVSPKEFISQTRFRHALAAIRRAGENESLSDIAIACGYYDHAHLTNEITKYAGAPPARL